jgi:hypothetical protein
VKRHVWDVDEEEGDVGDIVWMHFCYVVNHRK